MKQESIELLLSIMAYHSNYPIVFSKKEEESKETGYYYRTVSLPIKVEKYTQTMKELADNPAHNEYLMTIGIIDAKTGFNENQLHTNMVKFLATNNIEYTNDRRKENWLLKIPENIVQKNLKNHFNLLESGYSFVNHFYQRSFINRLRKCGEEKTKLLVKEYPKCN